LDQECLMKERPAAQNIKLTKKSFLAQATGQRIPIRSGDHSDNNEKPR